MPHCFKHLLTKLRSGQNSRSEHIRLKTPEWPNPVCSGFIKPAMVIVRTAIPFTFVPNKISDYVLIRKFWFGRTVIVLDIKCSALSRAFIIQNDYTRGHTNLNLPQIFEQRIKMSVYTRRTYFTVVNYVRGTHRHSRTATTPQVQFIYTRHLAAVKLVK